MSAPNKPEEAFVTVSVNDFTRTRDSVILALANLQSAVSDLSKAYINHANAVLNRAPAAIDVGNFTSSLLENGLLNVARLHSPAGEEQKKKRKRAPPDPNAPKRALTPYFLYMHHNRHKISTELGNNARPKDVADEGTRRWSNMTESERKYWQDLYKQNLVVYRKKMHAYKAGLPAPGDEAANEEAAAQQQLHEGVRQATEEESEESTSEEEEEEDAASEPVREPTPPRSSKRRRTLDNKLPIRAASPPKTSPTKKKGKTSAAEEKKRPAVAETPKSERKTRKKRKSGVE